MKISVILLTIYLAFLGLSALQLRRESENSAKLKYAIDTTRKITRGEIAGGLNRTDQMLRAMEYVRRDATEQSRLYVWLAMGFTLPVALGVMREFERRKKA